MIALHSSSVEGFTPRNRILLENGVDETVDLADGETPVLRSELEVDLGVQIVLSFDLLHDVADEGQSELGAVALRDGEEFFLGLHAFHYTHLSAASTPYLMFFSIDVSACTGTVYGTPMERCVVTRYILPFINLTSHQKP